MTLRVVLSVVLLLLAEDLGKRFRQAFRPYDVDAPSRAAKRLDGKLPDGIVIESGPFDALIGEELKAPRERAAEREAVLRDGAGGPLVVSAIETLAKEWSVLADHVADVEKDYAQAWDRGYMEASEGQRTTRKRAAVLLPVYRTLQRMDERLLDLARPAEGDAGLLRHRLPAVRVAAVRAVPADDARGVLRDDDDSRVRMHALAALLGRPVGEVAPDVVAAVNDAAWNVRALAIEACVRGSLAEAVGAMIDARSREKGRLEQDIDAALHKLTGVQFLGDLEMARKWWDANRERIEAEAAARDGSGVIGSPWSWDRAEEAAAPGAGDERETSAFYGIPIVSRRMLFVIDISKSMESPAEAKPGPTTGRKSAYPEPKSDTKIEIAKWQLHRAIEALPDDAVFNVIVYSESYSAWSDAMETAGKRNKSKAHRYVDALAPNGVTNIADPLDEAFDLAGLSPLADVGKAREMAVDTIYLLSDGDPNRGRIARLDELLEDVTARNPPGLVTIHCVGIGEAAGSSFLQELARRNRGRYVGFR